MLNRPWEIRRYIDENGISPFERWYSKLDQKTQVRISDRLDRVAVGNFGDFKSVGKGVYELRLFFGAGYRIYYATLQGQIILLLAGGDKKKQSRDIKMAQEHWNRYRAE